VRIEGGPLESPPALKETPTFGPQESILHSFGTRTAVQLYGRSGWKQSVHELSAPWLLSVFPAGAPKGSRSQVEIRGRGLEDAYAVWLDCPRLQGKSKLGGDEVHKSIKFLFFLVPEKEGEESEGERLR
jgi:hypothetical protein